MTAKSLNPSPLLSKRPPSAIVRGEQIAGVNIIRDQFTISTWLLLGAVLQGLLFLLPIRAPYLLGAAWAVLGVKCIDHFLMAGGWKRNSYLDGTIEGQTTARFPLSPSAGSSEGEEADGEDSSGKICVVMIGFRCNHPLGLLAPGAKQIGDFFRTMAGTLEHSASTNGFLGASSYLNASDRSTASEIMTVFYFDSLTSLNTFAHGPAHMEGWNWWRASLKEFRHLGIWHEVYEAPRGKWEILYENCNPTGAGATRHRVVDEAGRERWVEGMVKMGVRALRVTPGKMGMQRVGVDGVGERVEEEVV